MGEIIYFIAMDAKLNSEIIEQQSWYNLSEYGIALHPYAKPREDMNSIANNYFKMKCYMVKIQ